MNFFYYSIFKILRFSRYIFYTKINKLFFNRFNDHKISLIFNKKLSYDFIYDIFFNKIKILEKKINNYFIKKLFCLNSFLITLFVFSTRKLNEKLRFYVNYRAFNVIIIENQYSLSLIQKIFSRIYRIKIYIILNIIITFNILRIIEIKNKR